MLELSPSQQVNPALILAELATARRIADTITSMADKRTIERYIAELETELTVADTVVWPKVAKRR
ncbi:MAG TPA: hypothetical protein VF475_15635 [Sphingobium sp.]